MILCRQGNDNCLNLLCMLYLRGLKRKHPYVTKDKDQYAEALWSHKEFSDSMKSEIRTSTLKGR